MAVTGDTFVDAVTGLCVATQKLGVTSVVMLHRASGPTGLLVDNAQHVVDEVRRWSVSEEAWRTNPVMIELRRRLVILGPEAVNIPFNTLARDKGYAEIGGPAIAVPLVGPAGWFATAVFTCKAAPTSDVERELTGLATDLSVWCTAHGIYTLPEVRPLGQRQQEVAALAAHGRTNPEIAGQLGISINTVKLRLKQAFERFGVTNRRELAAVLRRLAPVEGIPAGITRRGEITITRAS